MPTPNIGLDLLVDGQASAFATHNSAVLDIDALLMGRVLDRGLKAAPGSPSNGDAYLIDHNSWAITAVNTGTKKFTIGGDQSATISATQKFKVDGSTGNDGTYTVVSVTAVAGPNTEIVVSETVPSATADGDILHIGGSWNFDGSVVPIGKFAYYYNGWNYIVPIEGWRLWVNDENVLIIYDGSAWSSLGGGGGGSGDMILASAQTNTGAKTFNTGTLKLAGSTSGTTILNAAAVAGTTTIALQADSAILAFTKDIELSVRPTDMFPPPSNYATIDTRNAFPVLDFDASTEESMYFVVAIPASWSIGSGINVTLSWTATSATSGSCTWGLSTERMNTDLDSNSFDTEQTGSGTANGTPGIITSTTITLTNLDGAAAGELIRIKVARKAPDSMSGDAELHFIKLRSAA